MRTLTVTLGLLAIGLGAVLLASPTPTGAVVGGGEPTMILGILLVLGGVAGIAMSSIEETIEDAPAPQKPTRAREYLDNLAAQYLRDRRFPEKSVDLERVARKCDCYLGPSVREGTPVYRTSDNKYMTVIPHGKISRGVSRGILETFAIGEPSFHAQARALGEQKRQKG